MFHATFATPDLTVFCCLDELGLQTVGQCFEPDRAVIECRVAEPDPWCRGRCSQALSRETDTRLLAHEPFGHRPTPTMLLIRVRRYKCAGYGRWRVPCSITSSSLVSPRGWACPGWHTANDVVLAEGKRVLIDDLTRFDGVRVIGVDEYIWHHTRHVTVTIDLTPVREKTGSSRLLNMVEGRSKAVLTQ